MWLVGSGASLDEPLPPCERAGPFVGPSSGSIPPVASFQNGASVDLSCPGCAGHGGRLLGPPAGSEKPGGGLAMGSLEGVRGLGPPSGREPLLYGLPLHVTQAAGEKDHACPATLAQGIEDQVAGSGSFVPFPLGL